MLPVKQTKNKQAYKQIMDAPSEKVFTYCVALFIVLHRTSPRPRIFHYCQRTIKTLLTTDRNDKSL